MSPEVCESKPYDAKSDVWALGCILYELCVLKHAFEASNLLGLVFKIVQDNPPPLPDRYSKGLHDIVKIMLDKDPVRRPTAKKVLSIRFIKEHNRSELRHVQYVSQYAPCATHATRN
jgi:NIMA (never in mitosis gene a)-related kinase